MNTASVCSKVNSMKFNTIRIVKKLNDQESPIVTGLVRDVDATVVMAGARILLPNEPADETTLYVAIGGDGTVLHAAKIAAPTKSAVIGLNLGKVGFLADFAPSSEFQVVTDAINGLLVEQSRMMLDIDDEEIAMNDVVISHLYSDHAINYDILVNGAKAGNHTSNSLILSTPTGSTAYALNVSGAIIDPSLNVIEVIPVAAYSLSTSLRPLIIAANKVITIRVYLNKDVMISVKSDGRQVATFGHEFHREYIDITIKKHHYDARLLTYDTWNFFDVLSEKLLWNNKK